jgi:hypothetical protein
MTGMAPDGQARPARQTIPARQPGGPADPGPAGQAGQWRSAVPELVIAVILLTAVSAAGYEVLGPAVPAALAVGTAVAVLVGLRSLLAPEPARPAYDVGSGTGFTQVSMSIVGFWRRRAGLTDGIRFMAAYDNGLRPALQHLLAARLAERHGVNLTQDPDLARQLLLRGERDDSLWYWLDPGRPAVTGTTQPGIPARTLTRLINRLERL